MKNYQSLLATGVLLSAFTIAPATAFADSGFYVGGSLGNATVEIDIDEGIPSLDQFDEDDNAYKLFAGYTWELSAISLGLEGSYNKFGEPTLEFGGETLSIEPTGISAFGVASIALGPVDLFGKAGFISWDADAVVDGDVSSDDGTDPGYGVGLRFNAGRFQIRGEYEVFDIDEADLSMLSVGIAYRF